MSWLNTRLLVVLIKNDTACFRLCFVKNCLFTPLDVQCNDDSENALRIFFLQLIIADIISFKTLIRRSSGIVV